MNTGSSISMITMKPCSRILISGRNSSIYGISSNLVNINHSSTIRYRLDHYRHRCDCLTPKILGYRCKHDPNRKNFCGSDWDWGFNGSVCRVGNGNGIGSSRGVLGIANVRNNSTSTSPSSSNIEAQMNETSFQRFYIQGGLSPSVKPLVIERIENDVGGVGIEDKRNRVDVNIGGREDEVNVVSSKRKLSEIEEEAWKLLRSTIVNYCGNPVGTVAANDPDDKQPLNYDQVFIRDFVPSAHAFLLNGEGDIVKNFLLHTLQLQSWEKTVDCYSPGQGLMPASFKVRLAPLDGKEGTFEEVLDPDFGESAIGRVAPVDSGLWWIILLRAYGKITGDYSLLERVDVQTGIRLILNLCLTNGFDMFPTLLVTDGSCMIDRRLGIHGHPLEIQM